MQELRNGMAIGLDFQTSKGLPRCLKGKQNTFNKIGPFQRAKRKLKVVHSEVCGPMSKNGLYSERYLLIFVNDYTRKLFRYLIKSKDEVPEKFAEFMLMTERQSGNQVKARL